MGRVALAASLACLMLGVSAGAAMATTFTFDTLPAGQVLGTQYAAEGLVFSSPSDANPPAPECGGSVKSDPTNAFSSPNVAYSFCPEYVDNEGLFNPNYGYEGFQGQLSTTSTSVSVYAGAPGAKIQEDCCVNTYPAGNMSVTLQGFDVNHDPIPAPSATATEVVGSSTKTLLTISDKDDRIAYFTVSGPSGPTASPLEIDNLTTQGPPVPGPPEIGITDPGPITGYEGQTVMTPVTVDRVNGADKPITLNVTGLPTGVTLTGGATVPPGSDTTTLTFSVAASAPVSATQYTITASSPDATAQQTAQDKFTVSPGVAIVLGQDSVTLAGCSTSTVDVSVQQYASGTPSLSISSDGDTAGLTATLSSLSDTGQATLTVASNGAGGSGTATYTVTVHDGSLPSQSATLQVNRTLLTAQGIYVTQGSQLDVDGQLVPSGTGQSGSAYAGVTLVANKTTVARVYANAAPSTAASALLYGYENGQPLPGSPLQPVYGPLSAPPANAPEAALPSAPPGVNMINQIVPDSEVESNANAYTFTLPISWTNATLAQAPLQLVGDVQPTGSASAGGGCQAANSFTLGAIPFTEVGNDFNSVVYPIAMTVGGNFPPPPNQVFADAVAMSPLATGYPEVLPYLAQINISGIANDTQGSCGLNPSTTGTFSDDPLSNATETAGLACADIKDQAALTSVTQFVQSFNGGEDNGPHVVGVNEGVARGLTNSVPGQYSVVDGTANYRPITSVGHELFHQFGLSHASAACGGAGVNWPPDQLGELDGANGNQDGIGLNTTSEPYQFIANGSPDFTGAGDSEAYDLMSYCAHVGGDDPNTWVSPRNWQQLISNFGTNAASEDAVTASVREPAGAADPLAGDARVNSARLSVIAFVTRVGVRIAYVGPQIAKPTPNGGSGDSFRLVARGSHGRLLSSVRMAAFTGGHVDGPTPRLLAEITGEVRAAGVKRIQLVDDGKVMASRKRPVKAPRVSGIKVIAPRPNSFFGKVSWGSTNPEHRSLTVFIDYSRNRGRTWRTVFTGPDKSPVSLSSFFFTASHEARLRIRVSDGFNETDALSSTFTSLGQPPKVAILTKQLAGGLPVPGDAPLQLEGQAIDQQGQPLRGNRLRWYDGPFPLGTGRSISAGPLPPGINVIQLHSPDPITGRVGVATLIVRVSPVSLPFLKLAFPARAGTRATALTFEASASTPATLTASGQSYQLGMSTQTFSLPISAGATPLLIPLSVTANGVTTPFAAVVLR